MTSKAISGYTMYSGSANYANAANANSFVQQTDFSQFMNQSSSGFENQMVSDNTAQQTTQNKQDTSKTDTSSRRESTVDTRDNQTSKEASVSERDTSKLENEIMDQMESFKEDMADALGVSVDEINAMMQELGLTNVDLLNTEALSNLVTAISGESDVMSLIMNEELYATFQDLAQLSTEIVTDLTQSYGITQDDLMGVCEQMKDMELVDGQQLQVTEADSQELVEQPVQSSGILVQEKDVVAQTNVEQVNVEEAEGEESLVTVTTSKQNASNDSKDSLDFAEQGSAQQEELPQEDGKAPILGVLSQVQEKMDTILNANSTTQSVTSQQIVEQLVEYIKINVDPTVTEMEIQLQPATLGTVNVNVALKDGQLTAQFRAQNEMAREAIESQMVQLKETLQENGIKVQAIEVTIATHEFERNLDQNHSNQGQENQDKGNRRKINLDLSNEIDEDDLTKEEQIAVEMMKENGNTVDYTA